MIRCSHVWIDGPVDFGLSSTNIETIKDILVVKQFSFLDICYKAQHLEHCTICFLERYINHNKKWAYFKYWQKELRINRELVSSYYRQLRESVTPMNYRDYIIFKKEQAEMTGEHFDYKTK